MAAIVLNDLAAATITYNDVQFGGGDSEQLSTPPVYSFRSHFVYDDSNRVVVKTKYTLTVQCLFHETSEAAMAVNMQALRRQLSAPGKALSIIGLGTSFDSLGSGQIEDDVDWGPKPLMFDAQPMGQMSWNLTWIVEFSLKECLFASSRDPLAWAAFNFNTTWQNDFEGLCTRTIAGYVEIAMNRVGGIGGRIPVHVADAARDGLNVVCPIGFRRIQNVWMQGAPANRLDFTITDEYLPGDYLPTGCTKAEGDVSFESAGPGFAEASTTLNMALTTAPKMPRSLGGMIFLTAAITKQNEMIAANPTGSVLPGRLSISNGKFDRARNTVCSMTWHMTKCINDMMKASGIWKPAVPGSYAEWRASVQDLWGNRGLGMEGFRIAANPSDSILIDLCSNTTSMSIGATPSTVVTTLDNPNFTFSCPPIPEDGGWMGHDMQIRILREDPQSWHRLFAPFLPSPGDIGNTTITNPGERVPLGGPVYEQGGEGTSSTKHVVEHTGLPVVYVLVSFKGLRAKHKPQMPAVKSIAGLPTTLVKQEIDGPRWAFDILTCPAWFVRGWRMYRVNGYVPDVKPIESNTSCAAPNGNNQEF